PTNIPKRACLQAQIGLCPGLEADMTSLKDYRRNLNMLIRYITGKRKSLVSDIEKEMKRAAKEKRYEEAASLRNKLFALKKLDSRTIFGDRESIDISKDKGLVELSKLLSIDVPRRIEGFDISHMQGTDTVASMVVFTAGVPDKSQYRKFKSRIKGNDDFAHMREVIMRRFSESNVKKWGNPDLILIDGGKGQVSSALTVLEETGINIPLIGLAKRFEEIIIPHRVIAKDSQYEKANPSKDINNKKPNSNLIAKDSQYEVQILDANSDALKLLQRIRDESHRFAVSYHSTLKRGRQSASVLDEIPGIGPATRKKLIRHFGSVSAVFSAKQTEIQKLIGKSKANILARHLIKT
ncbi:MAG TPA: helix-hairpin-helix domain-containing protein, partial [Candidatus Saccharimonadales bacterium]|nr:helix-hairpin-helix domain-containing protein [Candidatus Saccharimonadales bacterium]